MDSSDDSLRQLSAEDLITLGIEYSEAGDYENGIAALGKAISLNSDYTYLAYSNRGYIYFRKGDIDNAIYDLTQSIQLDPSFEFARNHRGEVYLSQNDFVHAIADFTAAIDINPVYARALYNRFNAYFNTGEYDKAISDYKRAINRDNGIAWMYHKKIDFEKAIADLKAILQSEPDNTEARNNLDIVQNLFWFTKGPPKRQG